MKRSWTRFGVAVLCLMLLTGLMGVPLEAGAEEELLCFANIAELQEYCAGTYEEWTEVHYNGGSTEFVMDTDLVIPENLRVVVDGQVTVSENADIELNGIIDAKSIVIRGTLANNRAIVIEEYSGSVVFTIDESGNYMGYGSLNISYDVTSSPDGGDDLVSGLGFSEYEYFFSQDGSIESIIFRLKSETYFSTFEELKQLAQMNFPTQHKAYYVGTEPLVIEEDLVLPNSLRLYVWEHDGNGSIIIPEGVTLCVTNSIAVDHLIIEGLFRCWGLNVGKTIRIDGEMQIDTYAYLSREMVEVSGLENVKFADVHAYLEWSKRFIVYTRYDHDTDLPIGYWNAAEFMKALEEAAECDDPHIRYYIELYICEDIALSTDIKVPKNCQLVVSGWQKGSPDPILTIPEGKTVILDGFTEVYGSVKVNGTLVNNSGLDIYYDGMEYIHDWHGVVSIEENGSYVGKGNIFVNSDVLESYEPAIPGIDTSVYDIEKITNDTMYSTAYWALRYPKEISRTYGANRFDTAFVVADQMKANLGIEKFDAVVVASGTNFADALSGSYLAAAKNAPILLSFTTDAINNGVKDYIRENLNEGGTVYILGGESAVPASFETGLDGFTVKRLAGGNRFETNLMILEEAGVGDKPVLVCTGLGFADSLSASAAKLPILLVWNDLTDGQKNLLDSLSGNKLYIIGGESAVSSAMEEQLKAYGETERVAGGNRFETSVAIAETFFSSPKSAVLAYAWNFPDGLCGGPLAATLDAPLILTMDKFEAKAAEYVQNWNVRNGVILGGEGLISEATVNNIFN